jgi:single-strand DNA-binding protein
MFDTYVTVVGNVLTAPEWRRTTQSNALVANFKVASTARRLDRESGRWVDGNSLRVRVNCWRKLAEGVASSVMVGDPVVVVGRMYTRDWTDSEGNHRTLYELEAVAVGHDLSRGRGKFARNRPTMATSAVEDAEAETRVHGEETERVPDVEAPALRGGGLFDDDPDFIDVPVSPAPAYDPVAALRGGGFATGVRSGREEDPAELGDELSALADDTDLLGGDGELAPLPADHEPEPEVDAPRPAGPGRRGRGRVSVPA